MPGINKINVTSHHVINSVCAAADITKEELLSGKRFDKNIFARAITYKFMREKCGMTYKDIGRIFEKNHATIINGVKLSDALLYSNQQFRDMYLKVNANI
jgi:chromosomal replication initiation ATPase DnaA